MAASWLLCFCGLWCVCVCVRSDQFSSANGTDLEESLLYCCYVPIPDKGLLKGAWFTLAYNLRECILTRRARYGQWNRASVSQEQEVELRHKTPKLTLSNLFPPASLSAT